MGNLRRIEETLDQLSKKIPAVDSQPPAHRAVSFDLHTAPLKVTATQSEPPVPTTEADTKPLNLPKVKPPSFTTHRNAANPSLAASLLAEMQAIVEAWQTDLNLVLRQIQDLYLEGPIVDGWLESRSGEPLGDLSMLRHAEVDRLMSYIEEICATPIPGTPDAPKAGYRLCGVNSDGQSWSCPCPADQVPGLSLAIARYHKLRQLLAHKQDLETRLSGLAETLVALHGKMKH